MKNILIQKLCFVLDDIDIFPLSGWNGIENNLSDEGCCESSNTYGTQFDSYNSLSYLFCQYWNKRK